MQYNTREVFEHLHSLNMRLENCHPFTCPTILEFTWAISKAPTPADLEISTSFPAEGLMDLDKSSDKKVPYRSSVNPPPPAMIQISEAPPSVTTD